MFSSVRDIPRIISKYRNTTTTGNYAGEGRILGGVLIVSPNDVVFEHRESEPGDFAKASEMMDALSGADFSSNVEEEKGPEEKEACEEFSSSERMASSGEGTRSSGEGTRLSGEEAGPFGDEVNGEFDCTDPTLLEILKLARKSTDIGAKSPKRSSDFDKPLPFQLGEIEEDSDDDAIGFGQPSEVPAWASHIFPDAAIKKEEPHKKNSADDIDPEMIMVAAKATALGGCDPADC